MKVAIHIRSATISLLLAASASVLSAQQNDCVGAEVICDNGSVTYNPTGPGAPDLGAGTSTTCGTSEHQSAWYYFEFDATMPPGSIIEFTIIPNPPGTDYDFAIWGPSTPAAPLVCGSLGVSIRCDFAGGTAPTGIVVGGGGGGFQEALTVNPGDGFYLLVDNFNSSSTGFTLDWNGSAAPFLDCTASPACELVITAGPDTTICNTESIQLSALATGNTGAVSYNWTADPVGGLGFLSDPGIANPMLDGSGNSGTFTFTVTSTDDLCSRATDVSVTLLLDVDPTFPGLTLCEDDGPVTLPLTSGEGLSGTWDIPVIDPTGLGGTSVMANFTPDPGQLVCSNPTVITIPVTLPVDPTFAFATEMCSNDPTFFFPNTSVNGINGTWIPSSINPSAINDGTVTTTFTPNAGQCASSAQVIVNVEPGIEPLFDLIDPICELSAPVVLPTISLDGYTGEWDIPVIEPSGMGGSTIVVFFIPDPGQGDCLSETSLTIEFEILDVPLFSDEVLCELDDPLTLNVVSENGYSGTWDLPVVDPAGLGGSVLVATFTPDAGQGDCLDQGQMEITISLAVLPEFSIQTGLCESDAALVLPTSSDNGISGFWTPSSLDPFGQAGSVLLSTFTPDNGICAEEITIDVFVEVSIEPQFDAIAPLCVFDDPLVLPDLSLDGYSGAWDIPIFDPANYPGQSVLVTFFPDAGQGDCLLETSVLIEVEDGGEPLFDAIGPFCETDNVVSLPETSLDGIAGTWDIPLIDPSILGGTTVVTTFTPEAGICAAEVEMQIDIFNLPLIESIDAQQPTDCANENGTIEIMASGVDLEYSIDGGITWFSSNLFEDLGGGIYDIVVRPFDQTGCAVNEFVLLSTAESPVIDQIFTSDPTDCLGNDGIIEITAQGTDLEYSIDDGLTWQSSPLFENLSAGDYSIGIRPSGSVGCQSTAAVQLTDPESVVITNVLADDPSDCGRDDGEITVFANGVEVEYSIDGATWLATNSYSGLPAGTYEIIARPVGQVFCADTVIAELVAPLPPVIDDVIVTDVSDCGADDATLTVFAADDNLEFSIDSGLTWQSNTTFSSLAQGLYQVVARPIGSMSCFDTAEAVITAPGAPVIDSIDAQKPSFCGASDGIVTVFANGANLEYSVDGGTTWQSGNIFSGVEAGELLILVRPQGSVACVTSESVEIAGAEPPEITSINVVSPSACGVEDGSIVVVASGANLEYSNDGGTSWQPSPTFDGLGSGTYLVLVRPVNIAGCQASDEATLTAPGVAEISDIVSSDPSNCGIEDGTILVDAAGSQLEYSIDGGLTWQATPLFENLAGGLYAIVVRPVGSSGCEVIADVTLTAPEPPDIQINVLPLTGCGTTDAVIQVLPNNSLYEYSIDGVNWQDESRFENLDVGSYIMWIRLKDAPGCVASMPASVAPVFPPVIDTITYRPLSDCYESDALIEISASGDFLEYALGQPDFWQPASFFIQMPAGTYTIYVRERLRPTCIVQQDITIVNPPCDCGGVAVDAAAEQVSCFGLADGNVHLTIDGAPDADVIWSNGAEGLSLEGLVSGWYQYTINYHFECAIEDSIFIAEPIPLQFEAESAAPDCPEVNNGSINITAFSGGVGSVVYALDGGFFQSGNVFENVTSGVHLIVAMDENGCSASREIPVEDAPLLTLDLIDEVRVTLGESVLLTPEFDRLAVDSYSWLQHTDILNPESDQIEVKPVRSTSYTFLVRRGACEVERTVNIIVDDDVPIYIPNVFSPNGDGVNDLFQVQANPAAVPVIDVLAVYDRWGAKLFSAIGFPPGQSAHAWDGQYNGQALNPGVYVYLIEYSIATGETRSERGTITLVR